MAKHSRSRKGMSELFSVLGAIAIVLLLIGLSYWIAGDWFRKTFRATDCVSGGGVCKPACADTDTPRGTCDIKGKSVQICCMPQAGGSASAGGSGSGPAGGPPLGGVQVVSKQTCESSNANLNYEGKYCDSVGSQVCHKTADNNNYNCISRCDYCSKVDAGDRNSDIFCDDAIAQDTSFACAPAIVGGSCTAPSCYPGYCPAAGTAKQYCAIDQLGLTIWNGDTRVVTGNVGQTLDGGIMYFDYGRPSVYYTLVSRAARECSVSFFRPSVQRWLRLVAADNEDATSDDTGDKSFRLIFACGGQGPDVIKNNVPIKQTTYFAQDWSKTLLDTSFDPYFTEGVRMDFMVYDPDCSALIKDGDKTCAASTSNADLYVDFDAKLIQQRISPITPTNPPPPTVICPLSCEAIVANPTLKYSANQICKKPSIENCAFSNCVVKSNTFDLGCVTCPAHSLSDNNLPVPTLDASAFCAQFDESACAQAAGTCGFPNLCKWDSGFLGLGGTHCRSAI